MSRIPQPRSRLPQPTRVLTAVPAESASITDAASAAAATQPPSQTKIATRSSIPQKATSTAAKPSLLQKKIFKEALTKSAMSPKNIVKAAGTKLTKIETPTVITKRGPEKVVQQFVMEKTVQRTPYGEYIAKTVRGVDAHPSGKSRQLELTAQKIDPTHATESLGVNETVSVTSSLSITAKGKQKSKITKKKTVKVEKLMDQVNMNPHHVNRLVKEEVEDVENTLKMAPPKLLRASSLEKYPLKKRLQNLRLNKESMGLLEQSVIHPVPTADEVESEALPETMATIIGAIEKGATPQAEPNQIFNTLFPDVNDDRIRVDSVAPGPIQDAVIPINLDGKITEEILTDEMEKAVVQVQVALEAPKDDICTENKIEVPKRTSKAKKKKPILLKNEIPPWSGEDIANVSLLVGANPKNTLEPFDISIIEDPKDLTPELLSKGIEYFLDAETTPYQNKYQLRGTRLPVWFPGYMSAFPHLPELIKVNSSPDGVLHSAWKAVQPKIFPEDSILIA